MLKDSGEKVAAADKTEVEVGAGRCQEDARRLALDSELKSAHEKLTQASHKLAEAMYKANCGCAGRPGGCDPRLGRAPRSRRRKKACIDAEYVDVDDKK